MRLSKWLFILFMGSALYALDMTDVYAQRRGGGRGGGGGARGGGGGNVDLKAGRRGQYDDFPWDAQKLLEANAAILRQMPGPIQAYIVDQAKKWDDLFPIRRDQLALFFRKVPNTDRQEFNMAFGAVLQEFQGLQGNNRQGRRGQGARRGGGGGGPEAGAPRGGGGGGRGGARGGGGRGGGGRGAGGLGGGGGDFGGGGGRAARRGGGGGNLNASDFTPAQYALVERAFQSFVLADQGLSKGLVVVALTGSDSDSNIPAYLTYRGALFNSIAYGKDTRDWLSTVQTASTDAVKGKNLKYPSLFEYHNKAIDDKSHARTLAFYQSGEKEIPPQASKAKGYGSKYSAFTVNAPSLEKIAGTIEEELGTAIKQGKSQRYIERMIKPKLTPEALNLKKVIKDETFGRLVSGVLMDSAESRQLGSQFVTSITHKAATAALPDILFIELAAKDASPATITNFHDTISRMARYGSQVTFAIFDQSASQALILSPKIVGGQSFDGQNLESISASLAKAAGIITDGAQATPIADVKTR